MTFYKDVDNLMKNDEKSSHLAARFSLEDSFYFHSTLVVANFWVDHRTGWFPARPSMTDGFCSLLPSLTPKLYQGLGGRKFFASASEGELLLLYIPKVSGIQTW